MMTESPRWRRAASVSHEDLSIGEEEEPSAPPLKFCPDRELVKGEMLLKRRGGGGGGAEGCGEEGGGARI